MKENQVVENEPLTSPVSQGRAVPIENKGVGSPISQTSRPEAGVSIYVGQSVEAFVDEYGKPDRIEPSAYAYDWWIYLDDFFLMIGVTKDGKINQLYTADESLNISPFRLNQSIEDIYRFAIIASEIDVQIDENNYTFLINHEDLQSRPLIIYQDVFAQLYVDTIEGALLGIRFIDPKTIVLHQPYEMMYMGELLAAKPLSSTMQLEVNETLKRQVFELTNLFRKKYDSAPLKRIYQLTQFAQENSKRLAFDNITIEEEKGIEHLFKRLKAADIEHKKAEENTAINYLDAIEAVHGWMNSKAHRKTMMTKDFTHLGVGVYGQYYTQTFIKTSSEDQRKK